MSESDEHSDLEDLEDFLGEEVDEEYLDGDQGEEDPPQGELQAHGPSVTPTPTSPLPVTPQRQGRNGPRTSPSAPSAGSNSGGSVQRGDRAKSEMKSEKSSSSQRRPRGNLPAAPTFDGDRRKDPKCFKKYANRVDSYVAIAEKIIDDGEIGLRLHAALEGEAADFLEDVPARVFGEKDGWRVLLKVLKEKYDETRMSKVGNAMKSFFSMQVSSGDKDNKPCTMRDIIDKMDQAARACKDAGLSIPDPVMIYFFFVHSNSSSERQANLLLRTNGEYDWSKIKQAVELLYPTVVVKQADNRGRPGRGRGAHEVQQQSDAWYGDWPMPDASDQQFGEWLEYHDPVETVAEAFSYEEEQAIPEGLARELHGCFASHRENRQKLAKAVQARGYYVKGKGKSKGGKDRSKGATPKGKGRGKSGGKARGMSLEELKKVTTCADCNETGHWRGDPECRKSNVAIKEEPEEHYDDDYDVDEWFTGCYEYDPHAAQHQWSGWTDDYKQQADERSAHALQRTNRRRFLEPKKELDYEAYDVAKNIVELKNKARKIEKPQRSTSYRSSSTTSNITRSEEFLAEQETGPGSNYDYVKSILNASRSQPMSSAGASAVRAAQVESNTGRTFEELGSVWALLNDSKDKPDIDKMRVRQAYTMRKVDFDLTDDELIADEKMPRLSFSLSRRKPTVEDGRAYLTIDTACENTVVGSGYIDNLVNKLKDYNLMPLQQPEKEQYCFGPGKPQTSTTRLSIPVGIGGKPAIIRTSLIKEDKLTGGKGPNGIPFLAGQDWLLMMKAVIDIGKNMIQLPLLDVQVPISVDTSGHLVIAIDEYPEDGWPPGLTTTVDQYPGAVFVAGRKRDAIDGGFYQPKRGKKEREVMADLSSATSPFIPNFNYEPNHDTLNHGISKGPCSVQSDYWEYNIKEHMAIRHHCRPRTTLFHPGEAHDRPDTENLVSYRVTCRGGSMDPQLDDWTKSENGMKEDAKPWTGWTCFFFKGADPRAALPTPPIFGTVACFKDGVRVHVDPNSLTPMPNNKKIVTFDLQSENPIFEHASSVRQQRFATPEGQFGSSNQQPQHAELPLSPSEDSAFGPMASLGDAAQLRDELGRKVGDLEPRNSRSETPCTSSDGLRRGNDQGGDPTSSRDDIAKDFATFDDGSSGTDEPGDQAALPRPDRHVPSRGGTRQKDWQQAREVSGMCDVRHREEGAGRGVCHPDQRREGERVRTSTRNSKLSGRKGGSVNSTNTSLFSKLGQVLFALIATSFGTTLQDIGQKDFGQNSFNEPGWLSNELTSFPRIGNVGTGGERADGRGPVDLQDPLYEGLPQRLKSGVKKRLTHSARRALQNSRSAREIVAEKAAKSRWPKKSFNYDVLEVFGGTSMVSIQAARHWGLRVMQPIDIRVGIDLRKRRERRWLLRKLDVWRPRMVLVEYPCTPWSILQRNVNFLDDPEALHRLQLADKPFLKLTKDIFDGQVRRGGHALTENPATADSQKEPEIQDLRQRFYETTSCMCRFGMRGRGGKLLRKRVRWIATHKKFVEALDLPCRGDHEHEKVEGQNTALSAQYPPKLADVICKTYLDVVSEEDFGVHYSWEPFERRGAYFIDVIKEEDKWRPLLQQAAEILARKVQKDI